MPTRLRGIVTELKRLQNTHEGNPVYLVTILPEGCTESVEFRLEDNAQLGYVIDSREFKTEPHTFTIDKGRIQDATP